MKTHGMKITIYTWIANPTITERQVGIVFVRMTFNTYSMVKANIKRYDLN